MRLGTIGTGRIVGQILNAVADVQGITCEAVYSRKSKTGEALAERFGVPKVMTDIDAFVSDPDLDVIYIASPNSLHAEQARLALEHGKHVWLEKPFTPTLREAQELFALAAEKGVMLLEAIVTQSLPNYKAMRRLLPQTGRVKIVQCSYSQYSSRYDQLLAGDITNAFDPSFAGGALMDINVYNVSFVVSLFGLPEKAVHYANRHANGVDVSGILILKYPDFVCSCEGAKDTWGKNSAQIQGEQGYLYVEGGTNVFSEVRLETKTEKVRIDEQKEALHFFYEVQDLTNIIRCWDEAEYSRRKKLTLEVVQVLEAAREQRAPAI